MNTPLRLHRLAISGHCHRVELMLSLLGLRYENVEVDLFKREQKSPRFLALNPLGQVPVLEDGDLVLSDSNAILVYLAQRYAPDAGWLHSDPVAAARQQRWFSLAASLLDDGPATARFGALIGREVTPQSQATGHRLFAVMEAELSVHPFLVGDSRSLADISLYSYTSQAPIGGISLADYPHIRAWLARVEALPGFIPLPSALS
ncbi:MAG: glutathione S-transferase family protein [Burkholderiaceae bacterium]|nr:glutathione S-transferase family protein [Burkholderiaceae bacterium]